MSTRKDKITTDHSQEETERVKREQEYIKEKGHEVASLNTKLKNVDPTQLPSTEKITTALQHGQESLDRLKQTERGQQMGPSGEKVVEDIKRVLADQQTLIQEKNEGDVLQNIVRDFWALLQELRQRSDLKTYFEEWQGTLTSVFSSGDFTQFFHQTGDMVTSMRDTEEFLALASELIDLMKIVIAESTEKAVGGDTATKEELRAQREAERHRVARELRRTMGAITENDMWLVLVQKGKRKAELVQGARKDSSQSTEEVLYRVRDSPNFQRLLDDFKLLLQRLVGDQMSVDPLFDYSKKALDDLTNDEELAYIAHEMQQLLPEIAENPTLLDEQAVQQRLEALSRRADDAVLRFREDPNVKGARAESEKLIVAIRNSPTSTKLLGDLKQLWRDIASDKEGEVIDPDVLRSLRQLIVPLLVEHLNNIPLPSVCDEVSFLGKYVYTIDNMKISLPELIPENIHLRFEYEMDANPLELEAHNQHTYLYLQASNLQLHLHDCNFTYERQTIPKHKDHGVFDVDTVGQGLTTWMKMEIKSDASRGQYLDVLKSDVRISRFNIAFRESKHDKLYEMLTHLFQRKIKTGVIEMIQGKLKTFGSYFNDQIISIINQAKTKSAHVSQLAKDKTEQARSKMENLKVQAQGTKDRPDVQEKKEEAKSTAKDLLVKASEKVQERLDDAKQRVEQERRSRELDRAISSQPNINAAAVLDAPINTASPVLTPAPTIVSPPISDSPIPFSEKPPASPSLLSSSGSHLGSYTSPSQIHAGESTQFSPAFAAPSFGKSTELSAPSSNENQWVSAKPDEQPKQGLQSL